MKVLMDQIFQTELLVLTHPEIQTVFLRNYRLQIFHQVLKERTFSGEGVLVPEGPKFFLCDGLLKFRKCQISPSHLTILLNPISDFSVNSDFFLPSFF